MGNDNIKVDVQGDVHGSVVDKSKNKKVYLNKKEKDYWWAISLGISIVVGFLVWYFKIFELGRDESIAIGTSLFIILIMFNPKRRFIRAAWIVLFSIGIINFLSLSIVGTIKLKENVFMYDSVLKFTEHSNNVVSLGFIVLAGFLYWLDHREG